MFNLGVILLNVVWALVSVRALVIKQRRTGSCRWLRGELGPTSCNLKFPQRVKPKA